MKKCILLLLFMVTGFYVNAQVTENLYFNKDFQPISQAKGAAYKKTITIRDSVKTIAFVGIKEKTEQTEHYINDKPVGLWQYKDHGNVVAQYDFDYMNQLANEKLERPYEQVFKGSFDTVGFVRPLFIGGEKARIQFLMENIDYPRAARENGIEGTVYVSFIITKEGKIKRPKIVKSAHPFLDYEAIRLIRSMPKWNPGTLNGEPVDVLFKMPLKFTLG